MRAYGTHLILFYSADTTNMELGIVGDSVDENKEVESMSEKREPCRERNKRIADPLLRRWVD